MAYLLTICAYPQLMGGLSELYATIHFADPQKKRITCIVLQEEKDREGKMTFDTPRHKTIINLPVDYPRIKQFPEWFTDKEKEQYKVISSDKKITDNSYDRQLQKGLGV